jgi:formiminotetrahydrofolate cyclodeaminase
MRVNFLRLARRDEDAFNQVVAAFKLPKGSFEEQQKREKSIQEAFRQAALAPFETARLSVELLELLEQHKEEINKNAITDWGVAAHLAHAALEGALLNVKINLQSLDEVSFVNDFKEKIRALLTTGEKLYQSVKQTLTSHGL